TGGRASGVTRPGAGAPVVAPVPESIQCGASSPAPPSMKRLLPVMNAPSGPSEARQRLRSRLGSAAADRATVDHAAIGRCYRRPADPRLRLTSASNRIRFLVRRDFHTNWIWLEQRDGGGGNRTRVHDRTKRASTSVVRDFVSPGRLPPDGPPLGLAPLWCPGRRRRRSPFRLARWMTPA